MDRKTGIFIGMGVELVGVVVVFIYIGQWFDENFGLKGLGVAFSAVIAFVAWIMHLMMVIRVLAKQEKREHTDRQ